MFKQSEGDVDAGWIDVLLELLHELMRVDTLSDYRQRLVVEATQEICYRRGEWISPGGDTSSPKPHTQGEHMKEIPHDIKRAIANCL